MCVESKEKNTIFTANYLLKLLFYKCPFLKPFAVAAWLLSM